MLPPMPLPPEARGIAALSRSDVEELLGRWEDSPFTAHSRGLLHHGLAHGYVEGDLTAPRALVVQAGDAITEPAAFGTDPNAVWQILKRIPGWDCVNVPTELTAKIVSLLEDGLRMPTRVMGDLYFTLERDPVPFPHPMVRVLTPADEAIARGSEPMVEPSGIGDTTSTLAHGVVAGAIINGKLVSRVMTTAWAGNHVNLGANTVPEWRGRGLATAATALVCSGLRARGLIPTWSTGEPNHASRRVAEKLGFRYVGRRDYAIVEGLRPTGFRPG